MALKETRATADSRVEEEKAVAQRTISVKSSVHANMSLHRNTREESKNCSHVLLN
jgi:hypothetical protein